MKEYEGILGAAYKIYDKKEQEKLEREQKNRVTKEEIERERKWLVEGTARAKEFVSLMKKFNIKSDIFYAKERLLFSEKYRGWAIRGSRWITSLEREDYLEDGLAILEDYRIVSYSSMDDSSYRQASGGRNFGISSKETIDNKETIKKICLGRYAEKMV